MKKCIKKVVYSSIIVIFIMLNSIVATADSGIDSNYQSSDSVIGSIVNSVFSLLSSMAQLLTEQPGSEDYATCHVIIAIISIIVFAAGTTIYVFKLDIRKNIKTIIKCEVSLIPTIVFSLWCSLTKLPLILYVFVLIIYIVPFIIISKKKIKNKLQKYIAEAKEIDKDFSDEEFSKEAFYIYKEVQLAWMNFEIEKLRKLISEEMFTKYQKQLEEFKDKKQKNIMNQIEYKSNKIVDMKIEDGIEMVKCNMNVTCYDYIIDDKEKVIKGKKDEKYNYLYELTFSRNMESDKYLLVGKKMKKIKIEK